MTMTSTAMAQEAGLCLRTSTTEDHDPGVRHAFITAALDAGVPSRDAASRGSARSRLLTN